ncbi:hypothetical protein, partial [Ralstonia solanacearum]|uniref:hypothetical protein n=1 Tax=Ralstonia solanacearum TaxID=305 RepID=UPI001E2AEB88
QPVRRVVARYHNAHRVGGRFWTALVFLDLPEHGKHGTGHDKDGARRHDDVHNPSKCLKKPAKTSPIEPSDNNTMQRPTAITQRSFSFISCTST